MSKMDNNNRQLSLKFQHFFVANFPRVKNFARMLLKSQADAEDVAQDVFCKLWQHPEIWLNNEKEINSYLFRMTKNIVLNILKHQQVEQDYRHGVWEKTLLYELTENDEILKDIYRKELLLIIRLTLEKMPRRRRIIFELSRFRGLSYKEIAKKLHLSIRTVQHQCYLAMITLKKLLFFFVFLSTLCLIVVYNI